MPKGKDKKLNKPKSPSKNQIDLTRNFQNETIYIKSPTYSSIKHKISQPTYEYEPHLIKIDELTPGIKKSEYEHRRKLLFQKIPSESLLILPSMPESRMSLDAHYKYRQDSNFNYFTGLIEPYSLALFTKDTIGNCSYILFVRERQESNITWHGHRCGLDAAVSYFGANSSYLIDNSDCNDKLLEIMDNYINIYLDEDVNKLQTELIYKLRELCNNKSIIRIKKSRKLLEEIRLIKSESEINLLRISSSISSLSMIDTMQYCSVGMLENELAVKFEHSSKMRGSTRLSYQCAVASGCNAIHLTYFNNNSILKNGDLVLLDCGSEYNGYSSDITRTFPVNGKFNNTQSILYNMLLDISNKLIDLCRQGYTIKKLDNECYKLIKKGLKAVGVTNTLLNNQIAELKLTSYNVHFVSHFIGLDIHDCNEIGLDTPFKNGMTIAIEPAIYIPKNINIPPKFHNIGIRIEDNILITNDKPEILSNILPRSVKQIEQFMMEKSLNNTHRIKPFNLLTNNNNNNNDDDNDIDIEMQQQQSLQQEEYDAARTLSWLSITAKKAAKIKQQQIYNSFSGIRAITQAIKNEEYKQYHKYKIKKEKDKSKKTTRSGKQYNTNINQKYAKNHNKKSNKLSKSKTKSKSISTTSTTSNKRIKSTNIIPKRKNTRFSIRKHKLSNYNTNASNINTITSITNKQQQQQQQQQQHVFIKSNKSNKPKISPTKIPTTKSTTYVYKSNATNTINTKHISNATNVTNTTNSSNANFVHATNATNKSHATNANATNSRTNPRAKKRLINNNIVITKFDNNTNDTDDSSNSIVSSVNTSISISKTSQLSNTSITNLLHNVPNAKHVADDDGDDDIAILSVMSSNNNNSKNKHKNKNKKKSLYSISSSIIQNKNQIQNPKDKRGIKRKQQAIDDDISSISSDDDNNNNNNRNNYDLSHHPSKKRKIQSNRLKKDNKYNKYEYDIKYQNKKDFKRNPNYSSSHTSGYKCLSPYIYDQSAAAAAAAAATSSYYSSPSHRYSYTSYITPIYPPPPANPNYNKLAYERFMASSHGRCNGKDTTSTSSASTSQL